LPPSYQNGKQLKDRRPFPIPSPYQPQSNPKGFSLHNKVNPIKAFDKGKWITSEPPKRLEEKRCFKCHSRGHFQVDCPNRRTISIRDMEEIQATKEEESEEEYKEYGHTLVTPNVRELSVI